MKHFESCLNTTDEIMHRLTKLKEEGFEEEVIDLVLQYTDALNWEYVVRSIKEKSAADA